MALIPRAARNRTFWVGALVGVVAGPVVLQRFAPSVKAKLPAQ